ncbi:MAG: hypothetical protein RBS01_00720 [Candidatus Dojkabacteria bacterium]|jgi:hypothetical protein|nr:hypothetical protein [Candidatus Dojkabacteria bacterium]
MAPYNSELAKKNREILSDEEREAAYSLMDSFLSDINSDFQKYYDHSFNNRAEFIEFMEELLVLKYRDLKTPLKVGQKEAEIKSVVCTQEFYKIDSVEGDVIIKQLVSFSKKDLKYFSDMELEEVSMELPLKIPGELELSKEMIFSILDEQSAYLLAYNQEDAHFVPLKEEHLTGRYYTLLEATIPKIDNGLKEYFVDIEE